MKKILVNLIRTTISYSKFFLVIIVLSSSGSVAKADEGITYLKCGSDYLALTGLYIHSNYNIRNKSFMTYYKISLYNEDVIYAEGHWLTRDTGIYIHNKKEEQCVVIKKNELPKVNDEGKLF